MNALSITRNTVRTITVLTMTGIVMVATADGFAQSYSGLYDWALQHRLSGWKAESFPLLVDLFILVGELGLFLLALDGHRLQRSFIAWIDILIPAAVASVGWLVSLWFNVNHIVNATTEDKVTAGVPPVTAMVGLLILLRTIHRYMARLDERSETENLISVVTPEPESVPEPLSAALRPYVMPIWHPSGTLGNKPQRARGLARWALRREQPEARLPLIVTLPALTVNTADVPLADPFMNPDPVPVTGTNYVIQTGTTPEPTSNGRSNYGKGPEHPKWNEGVRLYRESVVSPGKALSQRDLAAALDMRNRSLAAAIIKYVKEENSNGGTNDGLSPSTKSATSQEQES